MQDVSRHSPDEPAPAGDGNGVDASDRERLAELRRILIGPEQTDLESLHKRLDDIELRAGDLAEVLPEAIARRDKPDRRLAAALGPTLEEAFTASVRDHPKQIADAIAPALGPAIRKSIADTLQRMMQSLTETLDHSLSPRSLRWRWEARRTGKPFAEIVLLHTLQYRVEQVFLIHRQTGLLLQHVVAPGVATQDADMVSGMLTAIRDFVRDSFGGAGGDESLDAIRVGERLIWVEQSPQAILAAVIWGTPPRTLHETLQDALSVIYLQQGRDLREFDGDVTPFERARPALERCLVEAEQAEPPAAPKNRKLQLIGGLGFGVIGVVLIGLWIFFAVRDARRWNHFLTLAREQPGWVITETKRAGGRYVVGGLRDPLSIDPASLARRALIDPSRLDDKLAPYHALHPSFIERRAAAALAPPATATLSLDATSRTLRATGAAPGEWIRQTRRLARLMSGVEAYDDSKLENLDRLRLKEAVAKIETATLRFVPDSMALDGMQDATLQAVSEGLVKLIADPDFSASAQVNIVGYATSPAQREMALHRADSVKDSLVAAGVNPLKLHVMAEASVGGKTAEAVGFHIAEVVPTTAPTTRAAVSGVSAATGPSTR